MVLGAGISTAICGSMRGSQTFEANCQTISRTTKVAKFGSTESTAEGRSRQRLLGGGTAPCSMATAAPLRHRHQGWKVVPLKDQALVRSPFSGHGCGSFKVVTLA